MPSQNDFEPIAEKELESRDWQKMADFMTCGKCGVAISRFSEYSCWKCGRMLCDNCGIFWELCKDHVPMCNHPELRPALWNQPKPEPARVVGMCIHNYSCPVCGFGVGAWPCACTKNISPVDAIVIAHLPELIEQAKQTPSSSDWERDLDEI